MRDIDSHTRPRTIKNRREKPPRDPLFSDWIEYIGFLAIRGLIRAMPLRMASAFSSTLWRLIAPHLFRHQRALKHLRMAFPDKTEAERDAIARAMWGELGRTMAESFVIDRIAKRQEIIDIIMPPDIQAMLENKEPVIFVALHLGNWEVAAVTVSRFGLEVGGIYQRILNPLVDRAVTSSRAPYYTAGLFSKSHDAVKNLMRIVKDGKCVGIVSDLRDNRGVKVPFFGHMAKSSPFPAMLSLLYGAPIVAIQCVRIAPDKFRLELERVTAPEGADRDATIYNLTAAFQAVFERWIRAHPEQWMWAHRRWD